MYKFTFAGGLTATFLRCFLKSLGYQVKKTHDYKKKKPPSLLNLVLSV